MGGPRGAAWLLLVCGAVPAAGVPPAGARVRQDDPATAAKAKDIACDLCQFLIGELAQAAAGFAATPKASGGLGGTATAAGVTRFCGDALAEACSRSAAEHLRASEGQFSIVKCRAEDGCRSGQQWRVQRHDDSHPAPAMQGDEGTVLSIACRDKLLPALEGIAGAVGKALDGRDLSTPAAQDALRKHAAVNRLYLRTCAAQGICSGEAAAGADKPLFAGSGDEL
eukprot:TRINITY_DN66595_c0_g1_i1.p2 TRINITY_DN66595_c0_g1~~TRINITY_DN66595_c0_g1_i1.p2  ORF type:complete len:249 (+),score=64.02 TRINITY_DN66595_c0_g1_i1:75-749(+)